MPGSSPSKALKTLVRQGIPDDLRPDLWLLFSGGFAKKKASPPGHYTMLQRKAALGASGMRSASVVQAIHDHVLHECLGHATTPFCKSHH